MRSPRTLTVISLGGGVQSSVMALMAGEGAFDRVPGCAVFADTKWEPPSIYTYLDWLASHLRFPLYVVDNGRSLRKDVKALTNHSGSPRYIDIPVYLKGRDGQGDGIGRRQCTESYKIRPIRRKIRGLLGLRKRQRVPAGTAVELWLGISTDEAIRMKDSRDRWIENRYPLIEAGMSRRDCMDVVEGALRQAAGTLGLRRLPLPVPLSGGSRPSAGGRSCSPRRWRSTRTCAAGWPSPRSPTFTPCGCPSPRRSRSTKRTLEPMGNRTGSATSARGTVASERQAGRCCTMRRDGVW